MAEEGSLLFQVETNEVFTYTNTIISEFTNTFLQDSEDEDEVIRKQEVSVHLLVRHGQTLAFTNEC